MSAIGKSTFSIRKQDLQTQKTLALGVKKIYFYHQASAGDTSINLTALVMPAYLAALGKVNPSATQIASARLYFFQNNLTLSSSLNGFLQQGTYTVPSSTSISLSYSAAAGEVFIGSIDNVLLPSVRAVDGKALNATGTLSVGTTDFNVGQPFLTDQYPLTQIGAVLVYRNGQLQVRNTNNATAGPGADGDYQELPTSGLTSTIIRFNVAPLTQADAIVVVSNGLLAEQPTDSQMAYIESIAGQVNSMIPVLADTAGVPTSTFGANPSSVDLRQFGDAVISLLTAQVPIVTDPVSFPMVITGASSNPTKGTVVVDAAFWNREGRFMYIIWNYEQSAGGSAGAGQYLFAIPSGYQIDLAYVTANFSNPWNASIVGRGWSGANSGANNADLMVTPGNATNLILTTLNPEYNNGVLDVGATTFGLSNATITYSFFAKVPIVGWTANQTLGQQLGISL